MRQCLYRCLAVTPWFIAAWPCEATPPSSQPADDPHVSATTTRPAEEKKPDANQSGRFKSKAFGVDTESEPPSYVRTLSETGLPGAEDFDWLEFGLEHRTRWDHRDDDYRRSVLEDDNRFLLRSRGYLGVKKILDPFRIGLEFQDARRFNSNFPENTGQVDEADFLQAFGELFFEDALGKGRPFRLQAGRMTLDYVDRKLLGRNGWRNTTNAFDGFRVQLGQSASDWQFDFLAVQPVERRLTRPDRPNEEQWFYGLIGAWRRWDTIITLEPYYFILDQDRKDDDAPDREIHTMGLHAYGPIGRTGFDYDLNTAFQFGEDGELEQRAFAGFGEIGYTLEHAWNPRLSFQTAYATGDRVPDDRLNERFDRLFAPNHSWSTFNYISWQNLILTKLRLEARPLRQLRFDTSYGTYWLASDSDAWVFGNRRDPQGRSGDFIGQEIDVRLRYQIDPRIELELGYAHLFVGPFIEETGPADDSDFFYVQTTFQLFE